jgi:hypothetical protein
MALDDGTRLLRKQSQPAGSGCNASSQYMAYNTDGLVTQRKEFNGNLTQYGYNENKLENVRVEGVTTTATTLSDTAVLLILFPMQLSPPVSAKSALNGILIGESKLALLKRKKSPRYL